jgi:hypothetical protein
MHPLQPIPGPSIPLLGARRQPQISPEQMYLGCYFGLIPVVAANRLSRGYEVEGGLTETATPERIAEEAEAIADAALARLGIKMHHERK